MDKRGLSLLTAMVLLLGMMIFPVAGATPASGNCGNDLVWTLDSEGTLTISGTGEMGDYAFGSAPWYGIRNMIKKLVISDGVTSIDGFAFKDCSKLEEIRFEGSAPQIGIYAFSNVKATAYYYPDETWTSSVMTGYGGTVTWVPRGQCEIKAEMPKEVYHRGDIVTLAVFVQTGGAADIVSAFVEFDDAAFELVDGQYNSDFGASFGSFNESVLGLAAVFSGATPVSGQLGTVTLKVKEAAVYGSYTVSVRPVFKAGETELAADRGSLAVEVVCDHSWRSWAKVDDDLHERTCPGCGGTETEGHQWDDGQVTKEPTEAELGVRTYTCAVCNGTKTEELPKKDTINYGDTNGDGFVDGRDVIMLCNYLANYDYDTETSTVAISAGADANGDGFVDGRDVIIICNYLANYDFDTGSSTVVLGPKK